MVNLPILHDQLLAALAELEVLTGRYSFDSAELSRVRYRLSRVSGERRKLVERLCVALAETATGVEAERIAALRESNRLARIASTDHIGIWSLGEVAANWRGYKCASRKMRALMMVQIDLEKSVLLATKDPIRRAAAASQADGQLSNYS